MQLTLHGDWLHAARAPARSAELSDRAGPVYRIVLCPREAVPSDRISGGGAREPRFVFLHTNIISDISLLEIPVDVVSKHVPFFEELRLGSEGGDEAINGYLARYLRQFLESMAGTWQGHPFLGPCIRNHLLDLVARSLESGLQGRERIDSSLSAMKLRRRIVDYIRVNLDDPDLTPSRIAKDCRISVSYLHKLFRRSGSSVSRWVLTQRLHFCHKQLKNPAYRHLSISRIAYDAGFNSQAHFSFKFKQHFGMTARAVRASSHA